MRLGVVDVLADAPDQTPDFQVPRVELLRLLGCRAAPAAELERGLPHLLDLLPAQMPVRSGPRTPAQEHVAALGALMHDQVDAQAWHILGLLRELAHGLDQAVKGGNLLAQMTEPAPTRKGLYVNSTLTVLLPSGLLRPLDIVDRLLSTDPMVRRPFQQHIPFHTNPFHHHCSKLLADASRRRCGILGSGRRCLSCLPGVLRLLLALQSVSDLLQQRALGLGQRIATA